MITRVGKIHIHKIKRKSGKIHLAYSLYYKENGESKKFCTSNLKTMEEKRQGFINRLEPEIKQDKRWTELAIDCYKRGCTCKGCFYDNYLTDDKCKMKDTVFKLVKEIGAPIENKELILV